MSAEGYAYVVFCCLQAFSRIHELERQARDAHSYLLAQKVSFVFLVSSRLVALIGSVCKLVQEARTFGTCKSLPRTSSELCESSCPWSLYSAS